jgi:hypothetical protein
VNIGNPVERSGFAVFPIFAAQLNLFDKFDPKPPWSVADAKQRKKIMACNGKVDSPTFPSLSNQGDMPSLFLPGHEIKKSLFLNCPILCPPKTTIKVPALCYASARVHAARCGPVFPPSSAIGWASCGLYEWELHLFSHAETCKRAGWQPRLSVCSSLGFTPSRQEVEGFVGLIHLLDFRKVKSPTPWTSDWVALGRGVQASALFYQKRLVHLHSIRTL